MNAGKKVRAARLLAGLTLDDLAARLGVRRVSPVHWEKPQGPPSGQTAPLAVATGLPEEWLKGAGLEGLVTSRPVLPGAKPARNVLERVATELLEILPLMCPDAERITVTSAAGSTYLFHKEGDGGYCVAVFAREPLARKLQEVGGRRIDVEDDVWWDAYLQPDYQYLRRVLELAGCDEWAKIVPDGDPGEEPTLVTAKLEINAPEGETATIATAEIKRVIKMLRERGCSVSFSIEESSRNMVSLEGAPAGYKYRPLKKRHIGSGVPLKNEQPKKTEAPALPSYKPLSAKWIETGEEVED